MASEMLYPIMPIYLHSIGFTVIWIGILEGIAEATAGLSKGYFGKKSDLSGRRVPFVQLGYLISAVSKPMMTLSNLPIWIFFTRTADRMGKGIRTGARDALLSDESPPGGKGSVFGFHRSMDTIGAVLGPCLAILYLHYYPENYKSLFILAAIPGLLAVSAALLLPDKKIKTAKPKTSMSFLAYFEYWKQSPLLYRKLVLGLLLFALFNSSDLFLILKVKSSGMEDSQIIGMYILYNIVYAVFAFPIGILADKIGLKTTLVLGLILFSISYFGMAFNTDKDLFIALFISYGLYAAATEGISKAWITNITEPEDTATAIGTFAGMQSICTLIASSLTGLIWYYFGASSPFLLAGIVSISISIYILNLPYPTLQR